MLSASFCQGKEEDCKTRTTAALAVFELQCGTEMKGFRTMERTGPPVSSTCGHVCSVDPSLTYFLTILGHYRKNLMLPWCTIH